MFDTLNMSSFKIIVHFTITRNKCKLPSFDIYFATEVSDAYSILLVSKTSD